MIAVRGIYDGKVVQLLEPVNTDKACQVIVTFLEPVIENKTGDNLEPFIGMWTDFTPEEERFFQTISEARTNYFVGRDFEAEDPLS
jgi:hypothetical protein